MKPKNYLYTMHRRKLSVIYKELGDMLTYPISDQLAAEINSFLDYYGGFISHSEKTIFDIEKKYKYWNYALGTPDGFPESTNYLIEKYFFYSIKLIDHIYDKYYEEWAKLGPKQ